MNTKRNNHVLKENEKNEKIIIKCYKFYYEDFIIYFPVGGLDIKTNQEPITRLLNELFEYHQLTQISSFNKKKLIYLSLQGD